MQYGKQGLWFVIGLTLVATSVHAQDVVAMAQRGPRFLVSAAGGPVLTDVDRTPVLRRRISLELRDVTIGEALTAITRASGLRLGFSRDVVPVQRTVRLVAEDITVAGALSTVLFDAGVDVLFSNDQAAIVRRARARVAPQIRAPVSGRVISQESGAPIAGANVVVSVPDSTLRTTTSDSGTFRFADVPSGERSVTVRYIGFKSLTKKVVVGDVPVTLTFVLESQALTLDELVTTATGQQRRRDLGNAITTIDADSIVRAVPINGLTDLLENRVPGLTVQHTTGAPGDPSRLRLRGISSVTRGNDPVVIVDGVRVYAVQSEERSGNLTNAFQSRANEADFTNYAPAPSPLDQIDPNIIEKIEVFKGASAATLYGADAANGVIVITTKKGQPGPARWNASLSHGRSTTPGEWPEGYFSWGHRPLSGGRLALCQANELITGACVTDSLVRFQLLNEPDLAIFDKGMDTKLSLTASGGNQGLSYSVTGSYGVETGLLQLPSYEIDRFRDALGREPEAWMRHPHRLKTWRVNSNVRAQIGTNADVALLASIGRRDQQRSSLENQVGTLAGIYLDRATETYYQSLNELSGSPFRGYFQRTTASEITVTTGVTANWRPRSWFTGSATAGLNVIPRNDEFYQPTGLGGLTTRGDSGAVIVGTGRSIQSNFDLRGTFRKPIGKGFVFHTSVGANIVTRRTDDLISSAYNLQPGTSTIAGAASITATERRTNSSVFGWYIEPQILGGRFAFSTGLRLDGGSAHGARLTQSGGLGSLLSLPKLNGSWVISEEPWFPLASFFSSLRLRGSYGQAQKQPGPTDRLRIYTERNTPTGEEIDLSTLGNSKLKPERAVEFEGGFDADILDSRITIELTAYHKTQVDALMSVQLPTSVNGGGSVIQNIGNIRNTGLEMVLGATPVRTPSLTWSADLIYSRNSNTLVKLGPGVLPNKETGVVEGYPVFGRWAKPILGYSDTDGNGFLDLNEIQIGDSLVYMGRLLPDYTTALSTNLVLFGGMIGITANVSYESGAVQIDETASTNWVLNRAMVDPTAPLGEQAAVRASLGEAHQRATDYGLMQDISTFRFNTLGINYRAPARVARLLRAQRLTVGLQGKNLGLHSTYRGQDPNVSAWTPSEVIRDTGQIPAPRFWQIAFHVEY